MPSRVRALTVGEGFSTLILRREAPVPALTPRSAPHHRSSARRTYDFAEALPSPALREAAVELLGMPLQVLFTAEAISTTYRPKRNRTPRRTASATGGVR